MRQQAFSAVTTTVPAPGVTTTSTTAPPATSKAAQPNQAANFGGSTARASITAGVDGKGKAYIMWLSGTANVTPSPPSARMLSTSTDGGKTWNTVQAMPFDYDNASPRMAVSKDGAIHLVYQRNPKPDIAGYGEVYHQASTDGGKTWSERQGDHRRQREEPHRATTSRTSASPRTDGWTPCGGTPVTTRASGRNDMYYAYSEDNGKTWSANKRITDRSVDRKLGVWGANYDINSPPSVASTNAFALFGWDDTRNTESFYDENVAKEFGGGLSDVYTSVAQFEVVGPANNDTARIVLAAVVGLLLVGLILLGVSVAAKRRTGRPRPRPAGAKSKAKVG